MAQLDQPQSQNPYKEFFLAKELENICIEEKVRYSVLEDLTANELISQQELISVFKDYNEATCLHIRKIDGILDQLDNENGKVQRKNLEVIMSEVEKGQHEIVYNTFSWNDQLLRCQSIFHRKMIICSAFTKALPPEEEKPVQSKTLRDYIIPKKQEQSFANGYY